MKIDQPDITFMQRIKSCRSLTKMSYVFFRINQASLNIMEHLENKLLKHETKTCVDGYMNVKNIKEM